MHWLTDRFPAMKTRRSVHFSVDDTIWLFENLEHFQYESAFQQPTLRFFRELHELYGAVVSFYCFGEFQGLSLCAMTDAYRQEFEENNCWLRFGFHGGDDVVRYDDCGGRRAGGDYRAVVSQLQRIVGERSIDHNVRIHCYAGGKEELSAMRACGLRGVLCGEGGQENYCLMEGESRTVAKAGIYVHPETGLLFSATDLRIEKTRDVRAQSNHC
ncbi:hypothetical protein [Oscillibacter sp. GMB15532]|uniref:hypothetical protein n=1 Tax=Oscillibacter sp. GMB15532 TaxID=3230022 RepID=UPI0034DFAD65